MNLIALLFFAVVVVSCLPVKKLRCGLGVEAVGRTDNPLDVATSVCLKGIFALIVVLHHFAVHYESSDTWGFFQTIFSRAGAIAIGVFFMLSAFGLTMSYQKHGIKYLKKMLLVKIPKMYLLYVFINGFYILNAVLTGASFNGGQVVTRLLGLDFLNDWARINGNAWFMTTIIVMYLLFIAIFACAHKAKYRKIIDTCIITAISAALFIIVRSCSPLGIPRLYVRAITCFPLGAAYAFYYKQINRFLKKYWYVALAASSLLFVFDYIFNIFDFAFSSCAEDMRSLIACVFVIVFVSKVNIANIVTYRIGLLSLEFYLIHGLFLMLCDKWIGRNNQIAFTTAAMAISIAAAVAIYWLQKAVKICVNKSLAQRYKA